MGLYTGDELISEIGKASEHPGLREQAHYLGLIALGLPEMLQGVGFNEIIEAAKCKAAAAAFRRLFGPSILGLDDQETQDLQQHLTEADYPPEVKDALEGLLAEAAAFHDTPLAGVGEI